jgi:hypothetical protein
MAALTLIVIATRRPGKDTSILWASVLISISLALNINSAYVFVDALLAGRNYADLGANLLLLVGVYFLARAIHRAASPTSDRVASPRVLGKSGVIVAALTAAVLFTFIDAPTTSTMFMRDYGAQPAAALYSAVQYAYIGAVMATAGWTCLRFRRSWSTGVFTLAFGLVGLGCAFAVLLVVHVLLLDTLHVLGEVEGMTSLGGIYAVLNSTTFVLLCTGLALPPARRRILTVLDTTRTNAVLSELKPIWSKAVIGNSGITLDTRVVPDRHHRPRRELHRMIVEIQDSLVRDPQARERIGDEGFCKLARATGHLEAQSWRPR